MGKFFKTKMAIKTSFSIETINGLNTVPGRVNMIILKMFTH